MNWEDYYKHLDIPKDWKNISYGNDEFPSFDYNGFTIWINSPNKEEREENHLGFGYDNLDDFKDWIFSVYYTKDYGTENWGELLSSMDFDEVVEFVSKPNIESMKGMMDYEFNYHLDFENWDDKEFVDFLKDLLDGKTEYGLDDTFPKETVKDFIKEHWVPTKKEHYNKGGA